MKKRNRITFCLVAGVLILAVSATAAFGSVNGYAKYKNALKDLAERYDKLCADKSGQIGIAHADDEEGTAYLLEKLREKGFTGECLSVCYEPVTGSHVGPGTIALFFPGIHK